MVAESFIVAADDNRAVVIGAAAVERAPIFHVVEPEIIFVTFAGNFDFDFDGRRVRITVRKIIRANAQFNIVAVKIRVA